MATEEGKQKRVLVVGAGAAGMSCAHHLAQHPDRFAVTIIDSGPRCGGQAFSIPLAEDKHGAAWLNQGVQGGSTIFHHTLTMFARQGRAANPVRLQVSFGKGAGFWTNVYPTRLLARHEGEVRRFARAVRAMRTLELLVGLVPVGLVLRLLGFSREFATAVALPMVALFLGTGNYAPAVPSVMLSRLCTSPTFGMWYPPDYASVASNEPPMVVFPNLGDFYNQWRSDLEARGVSVRLETQLARVVRRDKHGVVVSLSSQGDVEERYDELVLCCLADASKHVLGSSASWRERRVLGAAKFSDDVTVTHCDAEYMRRYYENGFNAEQAVAKINGVDATARCERARKSFRPMYYTRPYAQDAAKLDMCFDCTNYQAQFPPEVDFDAHVFQTIFLNEARDGQHWTAEEIDPAKVIRTDRWHQLCHSWTHYVLVVPWLWLLQGRRHTRFAAAWTLVNAHETAVISGIAAAVDLGASYPADLERDRFALLCFRLYYLLVFGKWYRRRAAREGDGEQWATGLRGSVYKGPGLTEEERAMWREGVAAKTTSS